MIRKLLKQPLILSRFQRCSNNEDEESESFQERHKTPKTAVDDFSQISPSIAGFKVTAMIGSWVQRRKLLPKVLTRFEEDDIATKIQIGYSGMKTREDARPKPPMIALKRLLLKKMMLQPGFNQDSEE